MKPAIYILRLCLGATICGALAGILGGAIVGVIAGLIQSNAALGLDGALWGGIAGACLGALYGLGLALADSTRPAVRSGQERRPAEPAEPAATPTSLEKHPVEVGR